MKVLIVNATYGIGSTGKIVEQIGDKLLENGHQVYFGVQRTYKRNKNIFIIGNQIAWKLHAIFSRLFCAQGYCSSISTLLFLRKIKKLNIDAVNLHNLHSNFINFHLLLKFCNKHNIKVFLTLHDAWFFTGKCFHFIDANCNKFSDHCSHCPKKRQSPISYLLDRSKHFLSVKKQDYSNIKRLTVVGCSEWILNEAKNSILKNAHFSLIKNEIDTQFFKPASSHHRSSKIKVLGFANKWRLEENRAAVAKILNSDFEVTIVGCTTNDVKRFKLMNDRVILLPNVDRKELVDLYNRNDVFVNLSRADTYATVNMESICCGTPVVCFNVCSNNEMINQKTGVFICNKTGLDIEKCIVAASQLDRNQCSNEGKLMFNKNNFSDNYLSLFTSD